MESLEKKNKTKKSMEIAERREYAVKLRLDGHTYREIADTLFALQATGKVVLPDSYDERFAHRDVSMVMDEVKGNLVESGEMLRAMELENCNRLQNAVMDKALRGDLKAVDRVLAIMKQRAKYVPDLVQPKQVRVQTWQSEIVDLIKQGKITLEDVRDVSPKIAEGLMDQLTDGRNSSGAPERNDIIEGEYADVGQADEEIS